MVPGDLEAAAATVDDADRLNPARGYLALARRRPQPHRHCPPVPHQLADRTSVAPPLPCRGAHRIGGPATVGVTYRPQPVHRRAHPVSDHRAGACRNDLLEHAVDGGLGRHRAVAGAPSLACGRCQAASPQDLRAQPRPAVHREGQQRRRALPAPTRQRAGALGRRRDRSRLTARHVRCPGSASPPGRPHRSPSGGPTLSPHPTEPSHGQQRHQVEASTADRPAQPIEQPRRACACPTIYPTFFWRYPRIEPDAAGRRRTQARRPAGWQEAARRPRSGAREGRVRRRSWTAADTRGRRQIQSDDPIDSMLTENEDQAANGHRVRSPMLARIISSPTRWAYPPNRSRCRRPSPPPACHVSTT